MKKVVILSENNTYTDGKRVNTQSIETVTTLGDDLTTLANFQGSLAAHQTQVEQLMEQLPLDELQSKPYHDEIMRLTDEMKILKQAIETQSEYIRGFSSGTV